MHTSNIHTNTLNTGNLPFMDPTMDNNYTDTVMRGYSNQYGHSGNATISTISNANSILYGIENYGNDGWEPNFPSTEDDNIGNKIKIRISIDSKLPVEILNGKEEQQYQSMSSNSLWKSWENETTFTNSQHDAQHTNMDAKKSQQTSDIGINCKLYKIKSARHGKYSFAKTGDDKVDEAETPKGINQVRREDRIHNYSQTPSNWKEVTMYDINDLIPDGSTENSRKTSGKPKPKSFSDTGRRKTNEDFIQQTKCQDVAKHSIEDSQKDAQDTKWNEVPKE